MADRTVENPDYRLRHLRLTPQLDRQIETVAQRDSISISAAIRRLLSIGLRADEQVERRGC